MSLFKWLSSNPSSITWVFWGSCTQQPPIYHQTFVQRYKHNQKLKNPCKSWGFLRTSMMTKTVYHVTSFWLPSRQIVHMALRILKNWNIWRISILASPMEWWGQGKRWRREAGRWEKAGDVDCSLLKHMTTLASTRERRSQLYSNQTGWYQ